MLIDGQLANASDGKTFSSVSPFTEQPIGWVPEATDADASRAIAAARRAFDTTDWSRDAELRVHCLEQLRAGIARRREEFIDLIVRDVGNPVSSAAMGQVDIPLDVLNSMIGFGRDYEFEWVIKPNQFIANDRLVVREPYGVVAAITPYNVPLADLIVKLGPALAAGNTVILKPSPAAPLCAALVARLIVEETDFPPGVVNIITSSQAAVGQQVVADTRVDMVAFTGSPEVGRSILAASAPEIKKVVLELGGKSALIVLDESSLEAALSWGATQVFHMAGQGCTKCTRFLVPHQLMERAQSLVVEAAKQVPWGDPEDPATVMGPLITEAQRTRVLNAINAAEEAGNHPILGGGIPAESATGYFVEPTVFANVPRDSRIAVNEVFGPVALLMSFSDDADAIALANDSIFGLSGAVWAADPSRALDVARKVRTGTMSVNGASWHSSDTPFGGFKQSGLGRTKGRLGFEEFTQTKVIGLS